MQKTCAILIFPQGTVNALHSLDLLCFEQRDIPWPLGHKKYGLHFFFLVALSALGLFLAAVIGTRLLGKRDLYTIEFTDTPVSGLNKGAAVKYLGYSVGRIEDIYISAEDVNTVVVEISVEQRSAENAIRVDTEARMASLGITGLKYIELYGGSNEAAPLPSGSPIKAGDTFFSNLQERAEVLTVKIEQSVDNFNKLLSTENQLVFTRLLSNAGDLVETTNDFVGQPLDVGQHASPNPSNKPATHIDHSEHERNNGFSSQSVAGNRCSVRSTTLVKRCERSACRWTVPYPCS